MKNVLDYKDVGQQQFKIPKLLQEREAQKQEEYKKRTEIEVDEIGAEREDVKQMKELDFMYGGQTTQEELEEMEEEEEQKHVDPYMTMKKRYIKNQQFRTLTVGPEDMIQNGQMLQVSVCDPFDEDIFFPTDKVILCKHKDQLYALGSFCGYDFSNLG